MTSSHKHSSTGRAVVAGDIDATVAGKAAAVHRHGDLEARIAALEAKAHAHEAPPPPDPTPISDLQALINATPAGGTIDLGGQVLSVPAGVTIGRSIVLRNGTIRGSSAHPGAYSDADQHRHGVHLAGAVAVELAGLTIENYDGDGVYVANAGATPSSDITLADLTIRNCGRMGIAVVHGTDVLATRTTVENIGFRPIDVEPDWGNYGFSQLAARLVFDGGTVRGWVRKEASTGTVHGTSWAYIGTPAYGHAGALAPTVEDVVIRGWSIDVTSPTAPHWWMEVSPDGYRVRRVTFENNTSPDQVYGVVAARVDGFTFRGNTAPHSGPWPQTDDCTGVVVS